ncbi:hypothetical protein HK102_005662 [Quaeritorhiza haematococci]|nr:hypothetical protein HK102_005662 [Quaeritorhiza haematococci]
MLGGDMPATTMEMSMDSDNPMVPGAPDLLDPVKTQHIMDLLYMYFCNTEIKNVLASIPKSKFAFAAADAMDGWVPIQLLTSYKRFKPITTSSEDVITAIRTHSVRTNTPPLFELSHDRAKLRRITPFEYTPAPVGVGTTSSNLTFGLQGAGGTSITPAFQDHVLEAVGFLPSTTAAEVRTYFANFGPLVDVAVVDEKMKRSLEEMGLDYNKLVQNFGVNMEVEEDEDDDEGVGKLTFWVKFERPEDMVRALAQKHVYEDVRLRVQPRRISPAQNFPTDTAPVLLSAPTRKKRKAKSKLGQLQQGASSTQQSGTPGSESFPLNRIIKVTIPNANVTKSAVTSAFERFAPVVFCDMERHATTAYIRLKKSVAKECAAIIAREGGIKVDSVPLPIQHLEGEEESLYWHIAKERDRQNAAEAVAVAITAQPIIRTVSRGQPGKRRVVMPRKGRGKRRGAGRRTTGGNPADSMATEEGSQGNMVITEDADGDLSLADGDGDAMVMNANKKRVMVSDAPARGSSRSAAGRGGSRPPARSIRGVKRRRTATAAADQTENLLVGLMSGLSGLNVAGAGNGDASGAAQ